MMGSLRLGVVLAIAALAAACDPIMTLNGDVRTVPEDPAYAGGSGEDAYAGSDPVSGARIAMLCPDLEPVEIAVSDEDGRMVYGDAGRWRMDCSVEVEATGYYPQSFSIDELCVLRSGTSCHYLTVNAELLPRHAPATAADRDPDQ
jgi:hypothetical protein